MTGEWLFNKIVTEWFTRIMTTFIGMLLLSATIGTFAMAKEFISLKETVLQLDQQVDNMRERLRYLERQSEISSPYADALWEDE